LKLSPKIIVVTGAESTGKSELVRKLATHFNCPLIPEYAREYIETLNRKYLFKDVEHIARMQVEKLNRLKDSNNDFVFVDTWLVITKVWFDEVFGHAPDWIEKTIRNTKIDLFLICDTDLPWVADSVRENGGEKRNLLQEKYIQMISSYNFNKEIVTGKNDDRFINALTMIYGLK